MKDLTYPYCDAENDVPDDCDATNEHYECECFKCKKTFGFTIDYYPSYSEYELPCANGELHDLKPIRGYPEYMFKGKYECRWCGNVYHNKDEILSQEDLIKEGEKYLIDSYLDSINKWFRTKQLNHLTMDDINLRIKKIEEHTNLKFDMVTGLWNNFL